MATNEEIFAAIEKNEADMKRLEILVGEIQGKKTILEAKIERLKRCECGALLPTYCTRCQRL